MNINSRTSKINFTGYASGAIASFSGLRAAPLKIRADINPIQSGSGDPAPDNIRPIIGASECNVVRRGKNLFNYDLVTPYNAQVIITRNDGVITIQNNNAFQLNALNGNSFFLSSGSYTVSIEESLSVAISVYKDGTYHSRAIASGNTSGVITISEDGFYNLVCNISGNSTLTIKKLQIELGSTATSYEAYTGNTYTIALGDAYYGGSLDVTNGVLMVNKEEKKFTGLESWLYNSTNGFFYTTLSVSNAAPYTTAYTSNGIKATLYSSGIFRVYVADNADFIDASTNMNTILTNGIQFLYGLATPITVQLTPTQVEQLLGANNIFSDTGNVEVYYVTI